MVSYVHPLYVYPLSSFPLPLSYSLPYPFSPLLQLRTIKNRISDVITTPPILEVSLKAA